MRSGREAWIAAGRITSGRCERHLFLAMLGFVVLAPAALGADRPLAWDILGLGIAVVLLVSLLLTARTFSESPRALIPSGLLFLAVLAFAVFQLSPLPAMWINPAWDQAATALGHPVSGAIAVDRHMALVGIYRFAIYGAVFFLTQTFARQLPLARLATRTIAMAGAAYAAYGIIAYGLGNKSVLWLQKWAYSQDLTGTFVNRNSFATYLGLSLLATLCLAIGELDKLRPRGTWKDKFTLSAEFLSSRSWIVICLFLQATALMLTHSRGGNFSSLVAILVFALALSQAPGYGRARSWGLVGMPIIIIIATCLVSGSEVVTRFLQADADFQGRLAIYRETFQAILAHPILGTGLESFTSIFPLYRTEEIPTGFVNAAHDDYLEIVLELGVPAGLALIGSVTWLVGLCIRGLLTRRRDAAFPCLGLAASVLVGTHALVDFSLQIPAVTSTYMVLLGIGVAQSWGSTHAGAEDQIRNPFEGNY